jgi:hypothetical protein
MANSDMSLHLLLLEAVDRVKEAWPGLTAIDLGPSRVERTAPYAELALSSVSREFRGQNVQSNVEIMIRGRWPLPGASDNPVEVEKCYRIDEIVATMQKDAHFNDLANLPLVAMVDPRSSEDLEQNLYQVVISLTMSFLSPHH